LHTELQSHIKSENSNSMISNSKQRFYDGVGTKKGHFRRNVLFVDQTHKFSNLLEDIRKVEEFVSANYSDIYSDIGK